jgi:hypothetical protein
MTPKIEKIIEMCLENGINYGWRRAHKHTETPTEDLIKGEIHHAIELELYQWFDFGEKVNKGN